MKKFLALLLAAMMLLGSTAALAEAVTEDTAVSVDNAADSFDVTMVIPEGYTMKEDRLLDHLIIAVTEPEDNTPDYLITISHSEEYEGRTLNELSEDERTSLLATMDDDFAEPVIEMFTTEAGTEVYFLVEVSPESEGAYFANAFTIYKGYFIQVFISKPDNSKMTEDDLKLGAKLLSDMEFVDQE